MLDSQPAPRWSMRPMKPLTFRCPRTNAVVETGVETDPDTLASIPDTTMRIHCPHCGEEHEFSSSEGALKSAA